VIALSVFRCRLATLIVALFAISIPISTFCQENIPRVTWIQPTVEETFTEENQFTILFGVDSKVKISNVDGKLNDNRIQLEIIQSGEFVQQYDLVYQSEILLQPGNNTFALSITYGKNAVLQESRLITKMVEVDMAPMASAPPPSTSTVRVGKGYALIIANNDYESWSDLKSPVNHANSIAMELEEMYGFDVDLVLNADKFRIQEKLRSLYDRRYYDDEQILVFYIGHGYYNEVLQQGFIVPTDGKLNDEIMGTYISFSQLGDLTDGIPVDHLLLVIDACYGGLFGNELNSADANASLENDIGSSEFIKRQLRFRTRQYLISGNKKYEEDTQSESGSKFSRQFLRALRDYGGRDGIITLPELKSYMKVVNPAPKIGTFGSNESGSDFLFIVR